MKIEGQVIGIRRLIVGINNMKSIHDIIVGDENRSVWKSRIGIVVEFVVILVSMSVIAWLLILFAVAINPNY